MAGNLSKLWMQSLLNKHAIAKVSEAIQSTGQSLPCSVVSVSGSIVTVRFEVNSAPWTLPQVTIPKAESPWFRMPTQVGDFGLTMPSDVYLGGVSGLGGGVADMRRRGNLSTLMFVPVSNSGSPPDDQNAAQTTGPNGWISRTVDKTVSIIGNLLSLTLKFQNFTIVLNSSGITITATTTTIEGDLIVSGNISGGTGSGGGTAAFNGAITTTGPITSLGNITAGNIDLETHVHPYSPGSGSTTDTGAPTG